MSPTGTSATEDPQDSIWKALSDPTRRRILDLLRDQPRTTGDLCGRFPELSRFAVMKHLDVLEQARLITLRREGRERWNYLNAVPIQEIYDRWMNRFAAPAAKSLLKLKEQVESKHGRDQEKEEEEKPAWKTRSAR